MSARVSINITVTQEGPLKVRVVFDVDIQLCKDSIEGRTCAARDRQHHPHGLAPQRAHDGRPVHVGRCSSLNSLV